MLSAGAVFAGTAILHLTVPQFAAINIVLTLVWLTIAVRIAHPQWTLPRAQMRRMTAATAGLVFLAIAVPASAQETREGQLAAARADKATRLHEYQPTPIEGRILTAEGLLGTKRPVYPFIGSVFDGGGPAIGPGYRARFADSGTFDAHAAWSARNYKGVSAQVRLPEFANRRAPGPGQGRLARRAGSRVLRRRQRRGRQPSRLRLPFDDDWGVRTAPGREVRRGRRAAWTSSRIQATRCEPDVSAQPRVRPVRLADVAFVHQARRTLPRRLVRLSGQSSPEMRYSFRRVDAEVNQFVPILRENWVIALRAAASTTRRRRRKRRAVLPDAGSRRQPLAARVSDLALPRSQPAALQRRVPLDRRPVRRHGAVRRRRQGRRRASRTSICGT